MAPLAFLAFAVAGAQEWPVGGTLIGAGGGVADGTWGYGVTLGVTRRYGPVFVSGLGDLLFHPDRKASSGYEWSTSIPSRCVASNTGTPADNSYCLSGTSLTVKSGAMAEAGVAIGRDDPVMLGLGYRAGDGGGPYGMIGWYWPSKKNPDVAWFFRVAAGAHFGQAHVGMALPMP